MQAVQFKLNSFDPGGSLPTAMIRLAVYTGDRLFILFRTPFTEQLEHHGSYPERG